MEISARFLCSSILALIAITGLNGCDTAPKIEDRAAFTKEAEDSRALFLSEISGLQAQLDKSVGYAVFPGVGKWGFLFGGGQFGRGAVFSPSGKQEAWAAVSNPSIGLQIGGQGLQMLIVFQTAERFEDFKKNVLAGSASGTVVGGNAGTAGVAAYDNGVAAYITGQKGLMAGASVGLQYLRYMSLADAIAADKK